MANKPLTIGIDCRMLGWGGIGRYTRGLIHGLQEVKTDNKFKLVCSPDDIPETSNKEIFDIVECPYPVFSLRHMADFGLLLNRLKIDLFHSPHFIYPWLYNGSGVATIHDLIPIKYPKTISLPGKFKFNLALKRTLKNVNSIIAVSQSTKKDLLNIYNIKDSNITVTYEAVDKNFYPRGENEIKEAKGLLGLDSEYVLYVGPYKPHKNVPGIITAYQMLPEELKRSHKLVLVGRKDKRYREADRLIEKFELTDNVIQLENLNDQQLATIYCGAKAFVFMSFYEGFGLPPLEAMACRVPVLTSNNSSLVEMYDGKALIVDPNDHRQIAEGITNLLLDKKLRDDLIERGEKYVHSFSWKKMAEQTVDVYECIAPS